jgi:hypothetical protein
MPFTPTQRTRGHFHGAYLCRDQIFASKTIFECPSLLRGRLLRALSGSLLDNRIYTDIRPPRRVVSEPESRFGNGVGVTRNAEIGIKFPYLANEPNSRAQVIEKER